MADEYKAENPDYSKNHLVSVGDSMFDYFRQKALEQIENNKRKLLEEMAQNG